MSRPMPLTPTPLEKIPRARPRHRDDPEGALHRRRVRAARVGAHVDARLAARRPRGRRRAAGRLVHVRDRPRVDHRRARARRRAARALQRLPASREPAVRARPRPHADVHAAASTPGSGTSTARCAARPTRTTFPQGLPPDLRLGAAALRHLGRLRLGRRWTRTPSRSRNTSASSPSTSRRITSRSTSLVDDVTLEIDCNWKTCVDAFNEAYHVRATHPELLEYTDDVNVQIDLYGRHSRFIFPVGTPEPAARAARARSRAGSATSSCAASASTRRPSPAASTT